MKNIRITSFLIVVLFNLVSAQDNPLYTFSYESEVVDGDTVSQLYCSMNYNELSSYKKIAIGYNEKVKVFQTKNLSKLNPEKYHIKDDSIFFRVPERLKSPYLLIEGINTDGSKQPYHYKNKRGDIIEPGQAIKRWKKQKTRVDSMDHVRKYDNVFVGRDGHPRFKDKDNKTYIIYKDHIKEDKQAQEIP